MHAQAVAPNAEDIARLAAQADADLHGQKPAEAAEIYRSILAVAPDNVAAHSNLGLAYYLQGHYPQASEEFHTTLKLNPNLGNILALCGLSEAASGDMVNAIQHLTAGLDQVSEPSLRMASGTRLYGLLIGSGDLDNAAQVVAKLQKLDPKNVDVLYAAHQVYSLLAFRAFRSMEQVAPDSARMYELQGDELAQVRDIPAAIIAYQHAIAIDPHLPGIHYALGEVLAASKSDADQAKVEDEYRKALSDDPRDERVSCRLGMIELKRGHLTTATDYFQKALQIQPADSEANKDLGIALAEAGSPRQAVAYLARAVQVNPFDETAYYHLSLVERQIGNTHEAAKAMDQYRSIKAHGEGLARNYESVMGAASSPSRKADPVHVDIEPGVSPTKP